MTEDTGIMQLQTTKDCQQPPEASRETEQILPRRNQSHQQPDFELLASKTVRKYLRAILNLPVCCTLLQQP